jgi:LysM repeat protein
MKEEMAWQIRICPHLGQRSDPGTALSYPSGMNCCTHAKPVASIDLAHQENYCLTNSYPDCKEYNSEPEAPLPAGLYGSARRNLDNGRGFGKWPWVIIALVGLGIIAAWLLLNRGMIATGRATDTPPGMTAIATETVMMATVTINAPTPTIFTTITPTKERTATTRPLLGLEIPLGLDYRFVIHQIQNGDSLSKIAANHGTTVEALVAINSRLPSPLLPGWVIVVPLNVVDVQALPAFEVYHVTETISLGDLAAQLAVDLSQFKHYNSLPDDFNPQAGDYLLVPRPRSPTPTP